MQPMQHMQVAANPRSIIAGKWFCLFNVQAGVVIFSSMGCALMLTVTLLNLGAEENPEALHNRSTYYSILYCYTLPMLIGFSLLYVGANKPDANLLIIGLAIQCAFGVYWVAITALSFIDEPEYVYSVCVDNRCPETLWMYNTEWRTYGNECIVHVDDLLVAPPEDLLSGPVQKRNESTEVLAINSSDTGQDSKRELENPMTSQLEGILGPRSLYSLQNFTNDIQDLKQHNQTSLVSGNRNGTHYNNSAEERNPTNEHGDNGDPWNSENLGDNSTLLNGKNETSGPTRFARLAVDTENIELILQDLLQLLSKKPFANLNDAEKLRAVLYGSRVLGCTENIGNSMAKSIVAAVAWFVFVVYGNLGAFMLILELRKMAASGELLDALETRINSPHNIKMSPRNIF